MTQADRISQWANVPLPLALLVVNMNHSRRRCSLKRLRSACREAPVFKVRQAIAKAAVREGYSYSEIGRALNRDHSTIMYAVGAVRK